MRRLDLAAAVLDLRELSTDAGRPTEERAAALSGSNEALRELRRADLATHYGAQKLIDRARRGRRSGRYPCPWESA